MNLIERLHSRRRSGDRAQSPVPGSMPSIAVRNYDLLWQVLSMGRTRDAHGATLELVDFGPDDDLLDIGCGTGTLILVAAGRFRATGRLVGLDTEAQMIAQARTKADKAGAQVTFAEGSITAVPYPDESFDVVTSSLMLHHVPEDDHAAGFRELHRVLRPGGRLVVADLNLAQRSSVRQVHGAGKAEDSVRRDVPGQFEAAGFRVADTGRHRFKALSYVVGEK